MSARTSALVRTASVATIVAVGTGLLATGVEGAGRGPTLKEPLSKKGAAAAKKAYGIAVGDNLPFSVQANESGPVYVVVVKKGDAEKLRNVTLDNARSALYFRKLQQRGNRYKHTVRFQDYSAVEKAWIRTPGTYAWTAVQVDCEAAGGTSDCVLEGETREFVIRPAGEE